MRMLSKRVRALHGIKETECMYYTKSGFGVSKCNDKMGLVPSFSLPPVDTCPKGVPCATEGCYGVKIHNLYNESRIIWDTNYQLIADLTAFVDEMVDLIKTCEFTLFRWHVGGDFANVPYFKAVCKICESVPECQFLAFTKRYNYIESFGDCIPWNLNIVLSAWGKYHPKASLAELYAVSYVIDEKHGMTAPADSFICDGGCWKCKKCFYMRDGHVAFHKH